MEKVKQTYHKKSQGKVLHLFRTGVHQIFDFLVIGRPILTLVLISTITLLMAIQAQHFRLGASSDSLALKNDQSLKYYRSIKARYGSDDYLVITYAPRSDDIFTPSVIADLQNLKDKLTRLERIQSVTSILDVPLIASPPVSIEDLSAGTRTLLTPDIDLEQAKNELISSPFYEQLLMSKDGTTTALFFSFKTDEALESLLDERNALRELALEKKLSPEERESLKEIEQEYATYNAQFQDQWQRDIHDIRTILKEHKQGADIYLGGVPMIVADSIAYIERDLKIFGTGLLLFLIVLLTVIFRKVQWVLLPLSVCICVGICTIGFLGLVNWPVTIVSSNFIALLLIFTLSFCVHQIVRYRECAEEDPKADQKTLVRNMTRTISVPCAYMVFTTIVAFGSLVISDIKPIIDFGWMMAVGLIISFFISFTLFPALLVLLKPERPEKSSDVTEKITLFFADLVKKHPKAILTGFLTVIIFSVWGISQLYVQNRFIDYYKKDTAVYQGMEVIDTKLGGTTPLDIIIDAPEEFLRYQQEEKDLMEEDGFGISAGPPILEGYWFSDLLMSEAGRIHDYLDSLPETGKVLSFYTTAQMLQSLEDMGGIDRFTLGVLYNEMPQDVRKLLFDPYISEDGNQLRFSVRVFESARGLDRQELLDKIRAYLITELGFDNSQIEMTGMVVLYNNILQTLFRSQIVTVWVVFIFMFGVFSLLFRSIKVAAVALIPNITVTAMVLGAMGLMNIPLDIMTITIAAIAFGTADDNTIHYVYRMMKEYKQHGLYQKAVERAHTTIGRAVYYTGITVILGFSILGLSNFVPTIYFGLLTAFAMSAAVIANLVLLPLLMTLLKPMGPDKNAA